MTSAPSSPAAGEGRRLAVQEAEAFPFDPPHLQVGAMVGLRLAFELEAAAVVADAVFQARGAEAAGGGEDVDGLEQARLAGAVAAEEEVGARPRPPFERLEVAEVEQGQMGEQGRCGSDRIRSSWA
ncbi:MAG: hypothetical protein ABUL63_04915 [Acidobacteriota bacterium]